MSLNTISPSLWSARYRLPVFAAALWSLLAAPVFAEPENPSSAGTAAWDTYSDTWVATDALGRELPLFEQVGPLKANRAVGIFYFQWLDTKGPILDLSKLTANNPNDPQYGKKGAFHWWSEPWFGYYHSDDPFVIRKHAQMLKDAGVDMLAVDVTNGLTYDDKYGAICKVFDEIRRQGGQTPQFSFLANSQHTRVVHGLSKRFYAEGKYPELWFRWKGRPLLLTPFEDLSPSVGRFFTLRQSWAWTQSKGWFGDGKDKWPWLDHTPQNFGWHENPKTPEQIPVAVAEHPTSNIGRSFHNGQQPPPGRTDSGRGLHFAEQWKRALEVDPEFVFVTGWNEWIAQRFIKEEGKAPSKLCGQPLQPGDTYFVDALNQEFSRDIEPMKGGHADNYYYQMVAAIRRYKGVRPLPRLNPQPIVVDGRFDDWAQVTPEFRDDKGDPVKRNHPGCGDVGRYRNDTGRHDIQVSKVSCDKTNVYFQVRTGEALDDLRNPNWMLLYLNADRNPTNGWLGYDYVVNRTNVRTNTTTLEKHMGGGYSWGEPVPINCRVRDTELELAIPRSALGLKRGDFVLDFKWADNIQQTGHPSDFTLNGDAAPNDRFNYRAVFTRPPAPETIVNP